MSTLLGELIGRVQAGPPGTKADEALLSSTKEQNSVGDPVELAAEINRVIGPPIPVTAETVFIRAMEVVSDEVNEHGGRFSADEFDRLCGLIIDSPVLVAHDKRQLPVARNFKAEVITREGRPWVKVWFYWPTDTGGAQDLASRIDAGVIREVSIGFEFKKPECSVCGMDIRECEHQPFVEYPHPDGTVRAAHYVYRELVRVLETSLVYRGATPGTRIATGLFFTKGLADASESTTTPAIPVLSPDNDPHVAVDHHRDAVSTLKLSERLKRIKVVDSLFTVGLANAAPLASPSEVPGKTRYVVTPIIEGLPTVILRREGEVFLFDADNHEFSEKVPTICDTCRRLPAGDFAAFGWLVANKTGSKNQRPSNTGPILIIEWLARYAGKDLPDRSIVAQRRKVTALFSTQRVLRPLAYRWVERDQISRAAQLLSSSWGCRIYPAEGHLPPRRSAYELRRHDHFWMRIVERQAAESGKWVYHLSLRDGQDLSHPPVEALSAQRYTLGQVVPVSGAVDLAGDQTFKLTDPKIKFSYLRRDEPDSIAAVLALIEHKSKTRTRSRQVTPQK